MRLVSADQEAPCTRLQQWVLGLQVRLVFEQLCDIEADAVLGLAPADVAAGEFRPTGISHGLLLNPVDAAGRARFKLSDPASMKTLIAEAIHEVSHVAGDRHDECFASTMTNLVAAIRDREIERDIRDEMERMRDWQRLRQDAIENAIRAALKANAHTPPEDRDAADSELQVGCR